MTGSIHISGSLTLGVSRTAPQNIAPVAIGTFDEVPLIHFQIDARVAKRAFIAVAGDLADINIKCFRSGHHTVSNFWGVALRLSG